MQPLTAPATDLGSVHNWCHLQTLPIHLQKPQNSTNHLISLTLKWHQDGCIIPGSGSLFRHTQSLQPLCSFRSRNCCDRLLMKLTQSLAHGLCACWLPVTTAACLGNRAFASSLTPVLSAQTLSGAALRACQCVLEQSPPDFLENHPW